MVTLQAGTQRAGPSTEEAAVLLLDRWVGPWAVRPPPAPPPQEAPRVQEAVRQSGRGAALASRGFLTELGLRCEFGCSPGWRACTICCAQPCKKPGKQNLVRLKRCPVWL